MRSAVQGAGCRVRVEGQGARYGCRVRVQGQGAGSGCRVRVHTLDMLTQFFEGSMVDTLLGAAHQKIMA